MSTQTLDGISLYPPRGSGGGAAVLAAPHDEGLAMAEWTRALSPSIIAEMLRVMSRPGLISFALGLPSPQLFPTEAYLAAAGAALDDRNSLQYRPPFAPLKEHVVRTMARRGVRCTPEQIILTNGGQQALSLLARLFLEKGSPLLCERLVYSGFLQVIDPYQPEVLTVGTDLETGMDVDAVEAILESGARPAFLYAITDGHNPLGVSISAAKRERLVALARRFRVPIVEDDAYGLLSFERPVLPMRALDDRWVFYVGSFSKIMAPGFRVGWIVAPPEALPLLSYAKDASDIDTCTFAQRLVCEYLSSGHLERHIPVLQSEYRARRDAMMAGLREHFPAGTRWGVPRNGLLLWAELPGGLDAAEILTESVETEGVAFVPGHAYAVPGTGAGKSCMRLNFSHPTLAEIEEGMARLGRVVRRALG